MANSETLEKVYQTIACLRARGIQRIDVKLVAQTAGVARSTFYQDDSDWREVRAVIGGKASDRIKLVTVEAENKSTGEQQFDTIESRLCEAEADLAHMQSTAQKVYQELIDEVQRWFMKASAKPAQQAKIAKHINELASSRKELERLRSENDLLRVQIKVQEPAGQFIVKKTIIVDTLESPGIFFTNFLEQLDSLVPQIRASVASVTAYVLCGFPFSGKSEWIRTHQPQSGGFHVYIDSCAHSADLRGFIVNRMKNSLNANLVCVWLKADEETCLKRAGASKVRSDALLKRKKIQQIISLFEAPSLDEPFDSYQTPRGKSS